MKKILVCALVIVLVFALAACGGSDNNSTETNNSSPQEGSAQATTPESSSGNTVALVTNGNPLGVNDKGFIQSAWDAVVEFCEANDITYNYFQPTDMTEESYNASFETACNSGAEIVVAVGFQLAESTALAARTYPDTSFLCAVVPGVAEQMEDNIYSMDFETVESGFFAGIGAVYEGYTDIGVLSCYPIPAVDKYPFGFIQGVDWAAKEYGIDGISVKHYYTGTSTPSPEVQALAASWYDSGTEVIATFGSASNASIFAASEAAQKPSIGCDSNQNSEASTILYSAVQRINVGVKHGLELWHEGAFPGGESTVLTAADDATGLDMEGGAWDKFTPEIYESLFADYLADKNGMKTNLILYSEAPTIEEVWAKMDSPVIEFTNIE